MIIQPKIPNIIHFIFGLEKNFGDKPFSFAHYIAIKSAYIINKPDKIFIYYNYMPKGTWWEKAKEFSEPIQIQVPRQIFGNKIYHFAHKADVLRLLILLKFGGIYLDIDTICIKPLTPLLNQRCIMAEEKYCGKVIGLCNAVILSTKNNSFLNYWLSAYKTFRSKGRDKHWAEHSVKVPLKISEYYPDLITILPENSFHYPSYTNNDLKLLFEQCLEFPNSYIHHLWESFSYEKYLSNLTEEYVRTVDTTYNLIARSFI